MSLAQKIKLLLEWSPLLNYLIAISSAAAGRDRVYRALELCDYLATKTPSPLDNEALALIRGVLMTPAGGELLDYIANKMQPLFSEVGPDVND